MLRIKASQILTGKPQPLGTLLIDNGVNFAIFSSSAEKIFLLLYNTPDDSVPSEEIPLDPCFHKTGDIWHIFIKNLKEGTFYAFRAEGPHNELNGLRFDTGCQLLDPYTKAVTASYQWNMHGGPFPKSIIYKDNFDWQGVTAPKIPLQQSIIYEIHLKGFSRQADIKHPGTYTGLTELIPYLKELGITAVELLPVFEFDEDEYETVNPLTGEEIKNYWGYSTMAFFAPRGRFAAGNKDGGQVEEFKYMVRELHRAGIEIILDVVFNHTHEGNEHGPLTSFKGLDNPVYYMLYEDKRYYWNFSGCGNTLNCNHPVVRDFIIDSLRYWVIEMHVDGFRFDLASILTRDRYGHILENPPLIERIGEDPVLKACKLIAEPWDAAGAYHVGSFPHKRFSEWNDRFRDDIRRYWKNDENMAGVAATRLGGSSDIYAHSGRKPYNGINYITCHDGFTLNDLVSYNYKHNEANGQQNLDGSAHDFSWNCGVEGQSMLPEVERLRIQQIKNFMLTLILAQGVPMFLGGDEMRRTQFGNNNAYCQDNEMSWFNWRLLEKNRETFRFFKEIIALRRNSPALQRSYFYSGKHAGGSLFADIVWYDLHANPRDWNDRSNILSCRISGEKEVTGAAQNSHDIVFFFNPTHNDETFTLPPARHGYTWRLKANTAAAAPDDIYPDDKLNILADQHFYSVKSHSAVLLLGTE
jgi:isoamylase